MAYEFNREECWYKDTCEYYGTDECNPGCLRHYGMFHLFEQSGIPKNRQKPLLLQPQVCDRDAFRQLDGLRKNIVEFVENGDNLYLYSSNSGNGKTTWALKLMMRYFDQIWEGNGVRCRGRFVDTRRLLNTVSLSGRVGGENLEQFISSLREIKFVIWDDIITTEFNNHDYNLVLDILNSRQFDGLANVYTSNLTPDLLIKTAGERLYSRIYNGSKYRIELKGKDRRGEFFND